MPCLYFSHEQVLDFFSSLIHIAIEYFQEGNVGEYGDCHPAYTAPVSNSCGVVQNTFVRPPPLLDPLPVSSRTHTFADEPSKRQSIWMDEPGRQGNDGGAMEGYTGGTG